MTPDQLAVILQAINDHSMIEVGSWVAAIVTAVAAVVTTAAAVYALIFASKQIRTAQSGTKATFLVDLDRRWEGEDMKQARAKWLAMRETIIRQVETESPGDTAARKRLKRAEQCSLFLYNLRSSDPHEYNTIMSILGFFETVGYIIDAGYITADEIVDLFGESLREFDALCWSHIQKRIEESTNDAGVPTKLWEHACNLILHTRAFYGIPE